MALAPKFARIVEEAAQEAMKARRKKEAGAAAADRIRNPPQTVGNPLRNEYPLVYADANVIRRMADENNAPESPWLPKIFGVTRSELDQMSSDPARLARAIPAVMPGMAANPKGAKFADQLATPQNSRRIFDQLVELQKSKIGPGMRGWYVMDPAYQTLLKHVNGDHAKAKELYNRFNVSTGVMSPGSDVMTEIARGGNANWLANQKRLQDFVNLPIYRKQGNLPADMEHIPGHMYHSSAHTGVLQDIYRSGRFDPFNSPMGSPKVPGYIQASGVPETGFQIDWPVGDAHYARGLGFPDLRPEKGMVFNKYSGLYLPADYSASLSNSEAYTSKQFFAPIAEAAGLTPVQGQGLLWGGLGPATGVETAVGVPKLELIADYIGNSVMPRNRITDPVLAGRKFLAGEIGSADPLLLGGVAAGTGAGMAGYEEYKRRRSPKFLDLIAPRQR
jgi:hypothetical protein